MTPVEALTQPSPHARSSPAITDTAGWFGLSGRELFGWLCSPAGATAATGALLCPPLGEEEHNAHETFRILAHRLANRGIVSLRFDYHGIGDSTGRWDDPNRVDAWIQSVTDAAEVLRSTGVAHVVGVGMRLGAALAATAAWHGAVEFAALALWDPCSGKEMLRQGMARRPSEVAPPMGAVDTPGYLYSADTVIGMQSLDIGTLPTGPLAPRILVLGRAERPIPRTLTRRLSGPEVTWGVAHGQAELLDVPMTDSITPEQSLVEVAEFLAAGAATPPVELVNPMRQSLRQHTPSGSAFTESVVSLGRIGLFGILSKPEHAINAPVVALLNVANDRHTGPGRCWVNASRAWADHGFTVVRMDQSGTGDSPCHPGQAFGTMYSRHWLYDLPEALHSPVFGDTPPVLIGLCSGAYSAMEATLVSRVDAVYAINVILHSKTTVRFGPEGDPRRLAARPPTRPFLALSRKWLRPGNLAWRIYRQLAFWHAPASSLDRIIRRGTRVVLVMSRNDGRHFRESAYWTLTHLWRWRRDGQLSLLVDDAVDHPLMTQEGQTWAMQSIERDLLQQYG
ncbi:pimeloyl-ACP methyl ester carboxylesterase [Phycicoccus badiiscoriae]|uniref:Pimeloyl-ACP methyl ester carboxylesterase n=1 Tax=Pedococcus badiiscoriae TaxID=642776 RepID=A0A852WPW5_9MICO|nr:alpha/beta hydrolase [Pedococcus badiiscoriae]NYG07386.1 pimeloyl-ACP methyl ester carboxylesterase [Pedococcus badiiscoriae]